ncbi:phospholipase/carboxylesterase [Chitinophaga costaii]|uniref:Phospholipase/carboxylesterase n=1 Tax=Chitinophaga costaii TaxID=1335309 RepID=A0A1C4EL65_9BACT|nr:dienelactone hydrolase family protein [Chitinophaga costaii]PUZ22419.1 hypothetical protein DCM91_14185 [Chitinophaga costaii]SCC44291.1 phospholipase/carboxylesterase [Chitinophaga costaii]
MKKELLSAGLHERKFKILLLVFALLFSMITSKAQSSAGGDTLLYKIREATSKNNPVLLILLHGYGANEDDLLDLAQFFPNNYTIVSPRATFLLQPGSYQWYESVKKNGGFGGKQSDLEKSQQLIRSLTLKLQKRLHISSARTIISGFSQGANMSYQMGLLYPGLCKAIGVFSGVIFEAQKEAILKQHNTLLAIFIGHGMEDNRIPFSEAEKSKQWLESKQFKPAFYAYNGMAHAISPQEMQDFKSFVDKNIELKK